MINVTPFDAYKKYIAIKLHFSTEKYDYFKFSGKVNVNESSFEKRNDKFFFSRLSKKYQEKDLVKYLVCNFLENSENWIGDIINIESDDSYKSWQKKIQSLSYVFKQDISKLKDHIINNQIDNFDQLFKIKSGSHPYLLDLVLKKDISMETFIIMNRILNFFPTFDKTIKNPIIWKEFKRKCLKYEPFLEIRDYNKYKQIMKKCFIENNS